MNPYEQVIEELEDKIATMTETPPARRDYGNPHNRDEVLFQESRASHARRLADLCTTLATLRDLAAEEARLHNPFIGPTGYAEPARPFKRQPTKEA